jgi:hypothetical protein
MDRLLIFPVTEDEARQENRAETIRAFIKWINEIGAPQGNSLRICVGEDVGSSSELV